MTRPTTEPDGPWIQTASGGVVGTLHPRPEDVDLIDLAIALSWTNRYTGHVGTYSVATHSILVSRWVESMGADAPDCMAALLHDAHEAYLGDLSRPLQEAIQVAVEDERPDLGGPGIPANLGLFKRAWSKLRARHDAAILRGLGLDRVIAPANLQQALIKEADTRILVDERDALWSSVEPFPWFGGQPVEALGIEVLRQNPAESMGAFLRRYNELRLRLGLKEAK